MDIRQVYFKMTKYIPFNKPWFSEFEKDYILEALKDGHLSGDGKFTFQSSEYLKQYLNIEEVLITHSCTAALEMSALIFNLKPGDEVILPSYTFVSTANAFVLRGATPVFIDIDKKTLNIDVNKIEAAITSKTKIIVPVHYAGISCDMDILMKIAKDNKLWVVEDAAQAFGSKYKNKFLGSIGELGTLSFHATKNIISGEGGALLLNKKELISKAEIIREKGTNRKSFLNKKVDKYTWESLGSSYLPSEILTAFLLGQLKNSSYIKSQRMNIWKSYFQGTEDLERKGYLTRPYIPNYCEHNAHMFYIILREDICRNRVIDELKEEGISVVFHYIPLHTSPAGLKYGKYIENLINTDNLSRRILRLPMWVGLSTSDIERIIDILGKTLKNF